MVRIVTGKIDSGKTTRLLEIYRLLGEGDGIIAMKYMIGSDVFGFNIRILSTGQEYPYMIHEKQLGKSGSAIPDKVFSERIGPYLIYREAIEFIDVFYRTLMEQGVNPLFFDEVGKLEMTGKGYFQSIFDALNNNLDIYMTVREDLIEPILLRFDISEYEIISR